LLFLSVDLPEAETMLVDGGHFSVPLLALAQRSSGSSSGKTWHTERARQPCGRSDARHTSGETAGYALAHVIGDKAEHGGAIAFGLLSVVALLRPSVRNSFEHFGDEKLRLKLRHVLGYDFPSAHRRNVL
jgi:hypothetical protein